MGPRCLWVPRSCWVLGLRDGVTCLRLGLCSSSVLDCNKDFPSFRWVWFLAFVLGSPSSGWSCVLRPAIVQVAIPPSSRIGSAPSRWVPLLRSRCVWGLQPFAQIWGALPPLLLCIPSGCGHPLGQVYLFVTLDRERRITLVIIPFRCGLPFLGSSCHIHTSSFGSSELLAAGGCALALLVVVL